LSALFKRRAWVEALLVVLLFGAAADGRLFHTPQAW
jgi:hypothetical protein